MTKARLTTRHPPKPNGGAIIVKRVAIVGVPAVAMVALGAWAWSRWRALEARLDEQTRGRLSPAY